MTQKFNNALKAILEKNKVAFDRKNYIVKANYADGDSFTIELGSLKNNKKESRLNTENFR